VAWLNSTLSQLSVWPLTDEFEDSVQKKFGAESMSKQTHVSHPTYGLPSTEVQKFDSLAEFALFWDNVQRDSGDA